MLKIIGVAIVAAAVLSPTSSWSQSCKQARNCDDAVKMWCNGYSGADRDRDGIPCENVCKSRAQVDAAKKRVGCRF